MNNSLEFKIGINAVPLLSPWTGVAQYTYHLIDELKKLLTVNINKLLSKNQYFMYFK